MTEDHPFTVGPEVLRVDVAPLVHEASEWMTIGIAGQPVFAPDLDAEPVEWHLPTSTSGGLCVEWTITDSNLAVDLAALLFGWPVVWLRRPRMKRRAARRIAGYTRTGRRR